ncbi:MAG: phasin family protein [Betaproteobacteria bacterium]|jgi:phasin family protein|nr:phasin family protein [Rhodocyclaceae bacterium]MCA3133847.1 phasin family protein [Rhodocyclaceae bacterium]MCA3142853.1 phasin family protein [Rhodocyclaceae bacterium]MCA3145529.1 phasin family protein [Rhodocyclaceae bacterium]MCE2897788.1 phasin family protein [Betaproteobacteria bacterium]
MTNIAEQFAAFNKANVDAMLGFAALNAASAERFIDLHTKAAKETFAEFAEQVRTVASAKDATELLQLGTKLSQPLTEKAAAYAQSVATVTSESQAELAKFVDTQVSEIAKQFSSAIEQAAKSAPAGSDWAISAARQAVTTLNHSYDAVSRAGKQFAEMTETTVKAVAKPGLAAANASTAARKKA